MASAVFNPYKVLGVNENATQDDIKSTFRKKSKEFHPDTTTQAENHESQEFINIKKAYDILTNQEKRDTFDVYGVVVDFKEETKKLSFTIFLDVASRCPKGDPLDIEIKKFIECALLPKYEDELKAIEERIDLLQSRLSGVVKNPDDDFITERSQKAIEEYGREYKIVLLKRDLHKAALELLQKYKFDLERIEGGDDIDTGTFFSMPVSDILSGNIRKNTYNPGNIKVGKGDRE
jgi:hypothetical protein